MCGAVRPPPGRAVRSRGRAGGSGLCVLVRVCAPLRRCERIRSNRQPGEGSDSLRALRGSEQALLLREHAASCVRAAPRSEAAGVAAAEA